MNNAHIFDAPFHIVPGKTPSALAENGRDNAGPTLAGGVFALLDRLNLCRSPRILRAECVARHPVSLPGTAGNIKEFRV